MLQAMRDDQDIGFPPRVREVGDRELEAWILTSCRADGHRAEIEPSDHRARKLLCEHRRTVAEGTAAVQE